MAVIRGCHLGWWWYYILYHSSVPGPSGAMLWGPSTSAIPGSMCGIWTIDFQTCPWPGSNKPCHLACECPSRLLAVRISAGQKGCYVVESSFISPTQSCTVQHSNPLTHLVLDNLYQQSPCQPREGYILESLDSSFSTCLCCAHKGAGSSRTGVLRDNPKFPRMSNIYQVPLTCPACPPQSLTPSEGKGQKLTQMDHRPKYEMWNYKTPTR